MSKPNKVVEAAAKRREFNPERQAEKDANRQANRSRLMEFIFAQAKTGVTFSSMEEAESKFNNLQGA